MAFCKEYNERTASQTGMIIPVEITIFEDRSFVFVTKTPPTADLLRKALGVEKGSATPHRVKVGKISRQKLREIAASKARDLNSLDLDGAEKTVAGTARSMGIEITGD